MGKRTAYDILIRGVNHQLQCAVGPGWAAAAPLKGRTVKQVLFLNPPYISFESFTHPAFNDGVMTKENGTYRSIVADFPLGLLSLSAYIKKHCAVETALIDFNIELHKAATFDYADFETFFMERLKEHSNTCPHPDIVAISALFSPAYGNMVALAEVCRQFFPEALVLAGGGVPSNMAAEVFGASAAFHALCYGEGEAPLLHVLTSEDMESALAGHPSWITREKIEGNEEFKFSLIEDLDEIPFPDFSITDPADYRINPILATFPFAENKSSSMPVLTSRGCPHRCCFCASHTVHGRAMRYHSLTRVKSDFLKLKEEFGARSIVFLDDHLMSDRKRMLTILGYLRELDLTAFFPASLALYALDREVLEALKSVGLSQLVLSVESGSDRVLKEIMHKPLDLSIVKRVIDDCRDLGISTDVAILIGLPGETKQDIEDARIFLRSLDATWFRINIATPLLGSEMLAICQKKGYLRGDYIECDFKRAIVETEDFSREYIQDKVYELNLELNFVNNSEFRLGHYQMALEGFRNVLRAKSDHAFAHYFMARCYDRLGHAEERDHHLEIYRSVVRDSPFWQEHVRRFGLEA